LQLCKETLSISTPFCPRPTFRAGKAAWADVELAVQHYTNLPAGGRSLLKGCANVERRTASRDVGWRRGGQQEMEHPQRGEEKYNPCADCVVPVQQAPDFAWMRDWRPGGLAGDRWLFGHVIPPQLGRHPLGELLSCALQEGKGKVALSPRHGPVNPSLTAAPRPAPQTPANPQAGERERSSDARRSEAKGNSRFRLEGVPGGGYRWLLCDLRPSASFRAWGGLVAGCRRLVTRVAAGLQRMIFGRNVPIVAFLQYSNSWPLFGPRNAGSTVRNYFRVRFCAVMTSRARP
jgi:hypothetical protein